MRYDSLCKQIIKDMNTYGMCVVDDFLGMTYGLGILNEGEYSISNVNGANYHLLIEWFSF